MKLKSILVLLTLIVFSCSKKKEEKPVQEVKEPVVKDTIVKVDKVAEKENTQTLVFTVQIAALKNDNSELASLEGVNIYQENSLTKYRLGNFSTYREAKAYKLQIRNIYKDAFVQALKDDYPIPITEALQQ
ncbi:SPOR domain-containing protein [Polaribacter porphyrae]|uniref:SPOR domain-containing protein n=1 Tax=Polaribacter porphyrae TaxID=1137780 RepID=A0A2S7WLY8_9FLAO|nr:SPOR domain-containing protein [Polaribacter porphyrae]PQJ78476.1 hypothetical protein BTO18_04400 [Polaribacter porphyrae]